ncbi:hypothetical protein H2201_004712 [Coniosporium apollinis]|uniref:Uncharacterized protein n=1 Tax=Coniosporium apollinis TaxID=61459 RepID=A0ABQ9NU74_9PEZI|nr:hypothetical protein H2201_004712 [Coniosporium apollinis]
MNAPPYQWRAGMGYLPPMNCGFWPGPGMFIAPPGPIPLIVPGPVPQPAVFVGGPPGFYAGPPPVPVGPGPVPAPAPITAAPGNNLAGGLRAGVNLLFAEKYTTIHVIRDCAEPWKEAGPNLQFSIQRAPMDWSVGTLIDRLGGGESIIEVVEAGGGKFIKGLEIKKDTENAKKSLDKVGWNEKRGGDRPPVWVVLTKKK